MMDDATRRRIRDYVAPLAVGLDGTTYYGDIDRIFRAADAIAAERPEIDRDLLYLLSIFSGQEKWVARVGNESRTELFLSSVGVPRNTINKLLSGIERLEKPVTSEERVVHDAVVLESLGAYGVTRLLAQGQRERMDFSEIAGEIERAAEAPTLTERGEELASSRRRFMREFARRLREEHGEFDGGK